MASTTTKPDIAMSDPLRGISAPGWGSARGVAPAEPDSLRPSPQNALQALLAFSALHEQVRRRKSLSGKHNGFDSKTPVVEFDPTELFVLDDVLQLVAERAVSITGADGLAIALAENNEIVLRAAAGVVRPDVGARIDRDSAFSGASFRTAQVFLCDDTETDSRVNLQACRKLGARSMVAVPLCGRKRVIGLLEAFSTWPFGFNDSDVRNLTLLAELVVSALKPEDEDRFANSAQVAVSGLEPKTAASGKSKIDAATAPIKVSVPFAPPRPAVEKGTAVPAVSAPIKPEVASTPSVAAPAVKTPPVAESASPAAEAKKEEPTATPGETTPKPLEAAPKPQESPAPADGVASAPAPDTFASPDRSDATTTANAKRAWIPILLIGIVVLGAFAGGVWWKLNTAQIGKEMVPTSTAPPASSTEKKVVPQAPAVAPVPTPMPVDADDSEPIPPASTLPTGKLPHVSGIRHWSSPDSSTVVLDLEEQVQYEPHRLAGPDRIYFDLHDTQLAPELANKSIDVGDGLINRIRVAQPVAGMTRIVLETKADTNFSARLEANPYRLIVEVRKTGTHPKASVSLFPPEGEKAKLEVVVPPPTKEDLQLRARIPTMRIVVDAGHGGWDLGTVGRRGLLEKDLVLEIAQRLGKLLQSRLGADVIYTRQDDNYIPLDERAEMANTAQADLFISVHANYSDLPSARGVETYYTNTFSAPGSKEAGTKDADSHSVAAAGPTLAPADLHDRVDHSRRLAASVQRALYGGLSAKNPGLRDRGIKEAGFVVLTESAMPGILAEVSFVSSPTDEQKLRSDGYREQIAEALYKGIARYASSSKGLKLASAK